MLRRALTWVLPAALLAQGCEPNGFRAELKAEATVAGAPEGPLNTFPTFTALSNLDFDANPEFQRQAVTRAQVASARAESVKVRVLTPLDQNFDFLDSLQLFARSGDREVLVAEKGGIAELGLAAPNPVLTLKLEPSELGSYIAATSVSFILRARGRQPQKDTRLEATIGLRVNLSAY